MQQVNTNALQISMDLVFWMDNTEELYNLKINWANLHAKKIRKGTFNLNKAITGMNNLRIKVQSHYNKNSTEDHIRVNEEQLPIVLKNFCSAVMLSIWDNNRDLQTEASKYIVQLDQYGVV
jgi:hypothetical protein